MDIPSIELSERLLTDVCDLINEQVKKADAQANKPYINYTVKEGTREFERTDAEEFIRKAITRDLKRIKIWFRHEERRISIDIAVEAWGDSDFTVEGNDSTWVDGITARFDGLFKKYRNNNDLYHSRWKKASPIYIGLGILVGSIIFILGNTYDPINSEGKSNLNLWITLGAFVGVMSMFGWSSLLKWLFPKTETEFTAQRKYRKKLLAAITFVLGSVILGLIVNYLSLSFFG